MTKRYRFLLIQAFHLPKDSQYVHRPMEGPREARLMNFGAARRALRGCGERAA
jgi:hypothetical protein